MSERNLIALRDRLREFAAARQWERYHDPKNLSMALAVEAAELLELFQWLTPNESLAAMSEAARADAINDELADILIYLIRIADVLDVDLMQAVRVKIAKNEERFPTV